MSIDAFLSSLKQIFEKISAADPLKGMRAKAWDHFLELGLPSKSDDAFQYVPLRRLYELPLQPPVMPRQNVIEPYPECRGSFLVFVNGYFSPELSDISKLPKKIIALPFSEALKSYGSFLQSGWSKSLKEERDPFAILNLATHSQGLFFYVPPHTKIEPPIQALFLTTEENTFAPARAQIFLGAEAQVQWISTIVGEGLHQTFLEVALEPGASFTETSLSNTHCHLNFLRSTLKRDSRLRHLGLAHRGLCRHSLEVMLQGENSDVLLQGLWHLKNEAQIHTHVRVEHAAPHARSLQKFKGVLENRAQSSFAGKIYVHPNAEKTEAYQLNHNLLLSPGAIAQAKPNLEIFNPDVKASHGATVAQVDEEQLFYLQSRGLTAQESSLLLVKGFIQEMIDQIPHAFLRKPYV